MGAPREDAMPHLVQSFLPVGGHALTDVTPAKPPGAGMHPFVFEVLSDEFVAVVES
jgi:hypothetical protein